MTTDRSDAGVHFTWDDDVRIRVERRAREIRRSRRRVFGVLAGVVVVVGLGVGLATLSLRRPGDVRVATTAPDPAAQLAQLLPSGSSVTSVLPELRLKPASGGRDYGVPTAAELTGARGAEVGVDRQWISGTGSIQLQPGQQFPDEVSTVISAVVRFDSPGDAANWASQVVSGGGTLLPEPATGTAPRDLVIQRRRGELAGQLQYDAVFTDGNTAFTLSMVAGGSGRHDGEFVRLVQDWTAHAVPSSVPSTASSTRPR